MAGEQAWAGKAWCFRVVTGKLEQQEQARRPLFSAVRAVCRRLCGVAASVTCVCFQPAPV